MNLNDDNILREKLLKGFLSTIDNKSAYVILINRDTKASDTYIVVDEKLRVLMKDCDYDDLVLRQLNNHVFRDNINTIAEQLKFNSVIERLNKEDSFFINLWTTNLQGETKYIDLKFCRGFENYIVLMLTNITEIGNKLDKLGNSIQEKEDNYKVIKKLYLSYMEDIDNNVRTSLNLIDSSLQVAKVNNNLEEIKEFIIKVSGISKDLLKYIEDLTEATSDVNRNFRYSEEIVDIHKIIGLLDYATKEMFDEKEQHFVINIENLKTTVFYGDEDRILKLNYNLLENASKYTSLGGNIKFTIEELYSDKKGYLKYQVSIEDDGIGIKQEVLENVFMPLAKEKVEEGENFNKIGSIMGLPVAKRIVEKYDGEINISTSVDKGTLVVYSIYLRIYEIDLEEKRKNMYNFKGKNILIIDDRTINLRIKRRMLRKEGASVKIATSAIEVNSIINELPIKFDLVLLSTNTIMMDYQDIALMIYEEYKNIPVIAIVGVQNSADRDKFKDLGINGYVFEPFDVSKVRMQIDKILK